VVLDAHGALARAPHSGAPERAHAFDPERTGLLVAEGASIWMLEDEAPARVRGAQPRARVRAIVRANDATAGMTDWGTGHGHLAARLRERLDALGTPPRSIDLIVSGASGSARGDALEAAVLQHVFADADHVPIVTPKLATGEYGGGFLGAGLLAFEDLEWAASLCFGLTDAGPAPLQRPVRGPFERVLMTTLAAGGAAVWIVLDRVSD
jgi:3-oxoacyl-(acyl-carrier-protein) synthase